MLVTPESSRRNRKQALMAAATVALAAGFLGWLSPGLWILLALSPLVYRWLRRRCLRRIAVMSEPFPYSWEKILRSHVAFFGALSEADKERFRKLVRIFLDEVRITGIRTEVDDTI